MLADRSIRDRMHAAGNRIVIDPYPADHCFQPASVDLTLSAQFMSPYDGKPMVYPKGLFLAAGECILASTVEHVQVPADLAARVEGKSSWGRRFLMAHVTAGFIDPGFAGTITLELVNLTRVSQVVPIGEPIAQISFTQLDQPAQRPYGHPELGSHYQNQEGVTASAKGWT